MQGNGKIRLLVTRLTVPVDVEYHETLDSIR